MSDRFGRRVVVGGGLFIFILGCVLAALSHDIRILTLGFFLQGSGAVASALFAWVADATAPARRHFAMAMMGISIGVALVLGLSMANPLAAALGVPAIFWICAALSTISLLVVVTMPEPERHPDTGTSRHAGLGPLLRHRDLLTLNLSGLIMFFTMRAVFFTVPLVLAKHLAQAEQWKLYLPMGILGGMCMMAGSRLSDRGKARSMIVTAMGMTAVGYLLMGYVATFSSTVAGYAAFFAGFSVLEALLPGAVSKIAPADARGITIGVYNTFQYFGAFCGSAVAGLSVHDPVALYTVLLLMTAAAMVGCAGLRGVDEARPSHRPVAGGSEAASAAG